MARDEDERFAEEWRGFVVSIAQKVHRQVDRLVELDELIALGYHGLLDARTRFDPTVGAQFKTFAYYRVRGAMFDGVRKLTGAVSLRGRRSAAALAGADALTEEAGASAQGAGGAAPTRAQALGALDDALGRITTAFVLSASGEVPDAPGEDADPEEALLRGDAAARVRAAVARLPERERALVQGAYLEGRRFDEIATELGISKSWASRLHHKAMGRLRELLEGE